MKKSTSLVSAGRTLGARFVAWARRSPAAGAGLLLLAGFAAYLYSSERVSFLYDDLYYWELSKNYWAGGSFDLSAFNSLLRGYLFPLLLAPFSWLLQFLRWAPVDLTRAVGAGVAALLFGVVGPGLWAAATPLARPVPLGRRILFGALGFVVWRGYFNYPLTDFPALLALAAGLWGLMRGRSAGSGLLAGLLVAAAVNFRPVYLVALPVAGLLCWWPRPATAGGQRRPGREWARRLLFVVGLALVFYPQALLNHQRHQVWSPLVLTSLPGQPNLYLVQLKWGLENKKYETNVGSDYPEAGMFFTDPRGQEFWKATGLPHISSTGQYAQLFLTDPMLFIRSWAGHLFNGLDVQYPTPYVEAVFVSTWGLALLNYTVLFGGLVVVVNRLRQRPGISPRALLLITALLLPCAAVIPTVVECRFLLPLHLLLYAAVAFEGRPARWWRHRPARHRALTLAAYVAFVLGCFALSMNTQSRLEKSPRYLFNWQKPPPQPW